MSREWNPTDVKNRFEEAAQTIHRLPNDLNLGYQKSRWPNIHYNKSELLKQEPQQIKLLASPGAIDRLDEVLGWSYWVSHDQIKIIWAKAEQKPWKIICRQHGVSRATGARYWDSGLLKITNMLNEAGGNTKKYERSET
jgi:hypothetical protein